MARVVAYLRRSTEGEESKNSSLETQEEHVRQWADKEGHEVVAVYSDPGQKSYELDRPALNRLVQDARRHEFDIVACWRFDRFCRDENLAAILRGTLREYGVQVISTSQPLPDDPSLANVVRSLHEFVATQELQGIRARVADGKRARIRAGKLPVAGIPKYGYRFTGEKKEWYEVDPEAGPIVARIFDEYKNGKPIRGIAALLTAEGVPTPTEHMASTGVQYRKGKVVPTWRPTTVAKILKTRSYTGKHEGNVTQREKVQVADPATGEMRTRVRRSPRSWENGERVTYGDGVCPAIITEELYEETQVRLRENKARSSRNMRHPQDALLRAGIAVCGYCGRPMVASWRKKRDGTGYYRYLCQARHGSPDMCPAPHDFSIDARVADAFVWGKVVKRLTSPEELQEMLDGFNASIDAMFDGLDGKLAGLNAALAEAETEKANYMDAVGRLPIGHGLRVEYMKRAEDAHEKVLTRTAARDEMMRQCADASRQRELYKKLIDDAESMSEYLQLFPTAERKREMMYAMGLHAVMRDPDDASRLSNGSSVSMPTYEYLCESCGHRFEVFQHIADTPLTTCPNCSGHIHRVLFPAGIVFKGSGFYKTDSRGTSSASTPPPAAAHDAGSPASANGKTAQPTEKSEAKTESKSEPAAKSDTSSASGASASN